METLRARWTHFWFEPVAADNLGLCRVLFYGLLFFFYLPKDFSEWAQVSRSFWMPIWLFQSFHIPLLTASQVWTLQVVWMVALALSCVGLLTRLSTGISFLIGVYLIGLPHNFGKTHHMDAILVFVLGIMFLSRCGDRRSLDCVIKRWRRGLVPGSPESNLKNGEYQWPVRMVWLVFCLIFFAAGALKIKYGGLSWVFSESFSNILIRQNYNLNIPPLTNWGLWLARYGWLSRLLAACTLIIEVCCPVALFSGKARVILVPGVIVMLVFIRLLLGPAFVEVLICSLFWIPWHRLERRLLRGLGRERIRDGVTL